MYNILHQMLLPFWNRKKKSGPATAQKMSNRRSELALMQDGAPAHIARVTRERCSEKLICLLSNEEWPPKTPDLS